LLNFVLQMAEVFSSVWIAVCFKDVAWTADIIERQVKWKDNHGTEGGGGGGKWH
jgi:hypothetical protein